REPPDSGEARTRLGRQEQEHQEKIEGLPAREKKAGAGPCPPGMLMDKGRPCGPPCLRAVVEPVTSGPGRRTAPSGRRPPSVAPRLPRGKYRRVVRENEYWSCVASSWMPSLSWSMRLPNRS